MISGACRRELRPRVEVIHSIEKNIVYAPEHGERGQLDLV